LTFAASPDSKDPAEEELKGAGLLFVVADNVFILICDLPQPYCTRRRRQKTIRNLWAILFNLICWPIDNASARFYLV